MVSFSVPLKNSGSFTFGVAGKKVVFAGSRNKYLAASTCTGLLEAFAGLGFNFQVGCARGVDECFRNALSVSKYVSHGFVACAYKNRVHKSGGVPAGLVVPASAHYKAALVNRTIWLVKHSSGIAFDS